MFETETLALTLSLSPGEREYMLRPLVFGSIAVAITGFLSH